MIPEKHTTSAQVPEGGKFLKGLAVVDDIAYFGVSPRSTREARGDVSSNSELAAFCLRGMQLLWRREARLTNDMTTGQGVARRPSFSPF